MGLGCTAAADSRRRHVGGPPAEVAVGCQSQWLLLRVGPDRREAAAREAFRSEAELGARDWTGWPSGAESGTALVRAGDEDLSVTHWRRELVVRGVRSGDRVLLCSGARKLRHLHAE